MCGYTYVCTLQENFVHNVTKISDIKVICEEEDETMKAISEFSIVEEQLSGIEKYAVYFLEEETAEFAAEQLRVAEVHIYFHLHTRFVWLQKLVSVVLLGST